MRFTGRYGYPKGMARTPDRTPKKAWKTVFLEELARRGSVVGAARKARIARSVTYLERELDPAFAALWTEAIQISNELMLEEARRRAVDGTLRPVFQNGRRVGAVREYSDTLIIFLIKAHNPAYRDSSRVVVAGDPNAPVKHEHTVTLTPDDVALAASIVGGAGARVPADGGLPPV